MSTQLVTPVSTSSKLKSFLHTFKIFLPAIFGTIVEYYDYALYGFCASILAAEFFPSDDPTVALLKTFGIFLTGSVSKPIGALIFGHIGDRFGRQWALKISMIGIAIPTILIGLMPTYHRIGWMAPFFLFICRILQGMFTAGESDGVRIFIYEVIGKTRPCLANSLSGLACMFGIYLASAAFSITLHFEHPDVWRIPFLIGGALGILVFWCRRYLSETPVFAHYLKTTERSASDSLWAVILKNKLAIFSTILLCGSVGGAYHFYMVFFANYLSKTLQLIDPMKISLYTSQALLIYTVCGPIAGILADRFGPTKILKLSILGLLLALLLNAWMITQGNVYIGIFCLTTVMVSFFSTPGFVVILKKFRVEERYRCMSVGHAVGSMLFSGSAPMISLWFWYKSQVTVAPLLYFACLLGIGWLGLILLGKVEELP